MCPRMNEASSVMPPSPPPLSPPITYPPTAPFTPPKFPQVHTLKNLPVAFLFLPHSLLGGSFFYAPEENPLSPKGWATLLYPRVAALSHGKC